MVMGARQVGKSTLCEAIANNDHPAAVVSLDDEAVLRAARGDPRGFLAGLDGPLLIDEVQRAPGLILAIKQIVDRRREPGQFLLTGSANILSSRKVQEALTGRIEIVRLAALAQAEIEGATSNLVDALFAGVPPRLVDEPLGRRAFASRVLGAAGRRLVGELGAVTSL